MTPKELDLFARQCRHKLLNPQPVLDYIAQLETPKPAAPPAKPPKAQEKP